LIAQDEPLGLIVADNAFSRHPITEESERLLRLFAASASIALRNAQLIAQLRQSLQREKEMREQLLHSERLAVIGELATKIAHDLRSPLVTIGGYARQLQRHPDDAERVRRNAQVIVDEVERLERQLRDLLDFTTPRPPQLKPASLGELVQRLAELQRPSLEAARVTFTLDIPDHLPPVLMDELQMERVILNLWRNAVEAMPDGGTLSVRVWQEGDWVKLQVADTGEGIPAEVMENIFQPFFTTKRTGSGLGLAICEKIVTDHGGTIRLSSTVGQGTVVEIALPVAKSE
jgi:signal transduction histidine kinase